jgi:membrane fusion protein (multidrug efflux system)
MFLRLLVVLILLGAVFGGIYFWKDYQQRAAASRQGPPPPATVAVVTAQRAQWQPELRAIGTLVAANGIQVTTEVAGSVREILFDSGHRVKRGDVLVRLDDTVDQAELVGLLAERKLAELKYQRLAKLVRERSVSQSDVDEARAELDNTTAQVASKRAVIDKKTITAPFDGLLGIRGADIGEYLQPGAPIVPLEAVDPLFVDFSVPERHLPDLAVGQAVKVRGEAVPGKTFAGAITAMNPGIDVATRTVRLRATLANPEMVLRSGMFVEVAVQLPTRDAVITLPRAAVTYAPYGDSVFVVEERDGQLSVQRQQISTGAVRSDEVEVVEGLQPGQRVVLAGQVKLRNGQAVQIDNEVVPAGGTPGK